MPRILLGVTGSVAAINTPSLYDTLSEVGDVEIIATEHARKFFTELRAGSPYGEAAGSSGDCGGRSPEQASTTQPL